MHAVHDKLMSALSVATELEPRALADEMCSCLQANSSGLCCTRLLLWSTSPSLVRACLHCMECGGDQLLLYQQLPAICIVIDASLHTSFPFA